MAMASSPPETFITSLHTSTAHLSPPPFPSVLQSAARTSSTTNGKPATTTTTHTTTQPLGAIKGRNSAQTIIRPSARASKTNALAAITATSGEPEAPSMNGGGSGATGMPQVPGQSNNAAFNAAVLDYAKRLAGQSAGSASESPSSKNPARQLAAERAPPLDFSTIRTHTPRHPNPLPRPSPRLFGLEHAPVYHPTVEEFANPMEYIDRIAPEGREYGICKIVPPKGWRPPFALDTETFRFKTRLQQLNSMEASARASLNFLEQLYLFHRQQGSRDISIPTLCNKPVDMWKLKREVTKHGGYNEVTNERKWSSVGRDMNYNVLSNPFICSQLKHTYAKIILPFEEYVARVKLAGGQLPPDPRDLEHAADIFPALAEQPAVDKALGTKPMDIDSAVKEAIKPDTAASSSNVHTHSQKSSGQQLPGEVCEICTMDHDPDTIVLCDGCDRGYHLNCLTPPLTAVPTSQFFCDSCLFSNGADYGFDEGDDHSLYSFRRRADEFKREWIRNHPIPGLDSKARKHGDLSAVEEIAEQIQVEDHIEREFWRLVESPHETVEIEYGADVNVTADGGGFPNLEVHPSNPYSRDGWNLNNLPILAGSLLRYIKSDISGMTIPWIYIGMVFSTFAWHKEDHYTYSINYHHWGDTKTWYGIPGEDDEKLEAAMKLAAPELFEQQPDLMFQLVTLMSPGRLKEHGVRVCACDQRPNEFVVTFPRGYHSGFNHGFNFNEAVNFALPDWLQTGLRCVNHYRAIKKNPVFSHDELLMTISVHERNPRTSRWLYASWNEMVGRELGRREKIRRLVPGLKEEYDPTEREEEEYQCATCKTLCYLSQALSADAQDIACLDHFSNLPKGTTIRLRLRYSDEELTTILQQMKARIQKAGLPFEPHFGVVESRNSNSSNARNNNRKRRPSTGPVNATAGQSQTAASPVARKPKLDESVSVKPETAPAQEAVAQAAPTVDPVPSAPDIAPLVPELSVQDLAVSPSVDSATQPLVHQQSQLPSTSFSAPMGTSSV